MRESRITSALWARRPALSGRFRTLQHGAERAAQRSLDLYARFAHHAAVAGVLRGDVGLERFRAQVARLTDPPPCPPFPRPRGRGGGCPGGLWPLRAPGPGPPASIP